MKPLNKTTVCADGFSMSVQASQFHYCSPRNDSGPYSHVEVGFPSREEELLAPYVDGDEVMMGGVCGMVPVEVVFAVMMKHGWVK